VWFCGHSLGAALATLAADRYPATRGVCTFGCPRVGDNTFAAAFNANRANKTLRYVNHHDVVTHVPAPLFGYKHVNQRQFIARDGAVSGTPPQLIHFFDELFGPPQHLLEVIHGLRDPAEPSARTHAQGLCDRDVERLRREWIARRRGSGHEASEVLRARGAVA
jgi:pimeloyl-ACP methyl ester carboxylesterase